MKFAGHLSFSSKPIFSEMTRTIVDDEELVQAGVSSGATLSLVFNFSNVDTHPHTHHTDQLGRCAGDGSEFWDPVRQTCYKVNCGFLYNNVGGRCVFRNISKSLLKETNQECFKMTINPWELRRVDPDQNRPKPKVFFLGPFFWSVSFLKTSKDNFALLHSLRNSLK